MNPHSWYERLAGQISFLPVTENQTPIAYYVSRYYYNSSIHINCREDEFYVVALEVLKKETGVGTSDAYFKRAFGVHTRASQMKTVNILI